MFDLHRLRLLRELKHRGTLAAVAAALSYAPSSVSQQLSQLAAVGVPATFLPGLVWDGRPPTVALVRLPRGQRARSVFTATRDGAGHHPATQACRTALRQAASTPSGCNSSVTGEEKANVILDRERRRTTTNNGHRPGAVGQMQDRTRNRATAAFPGGARKRAGAF